MMHALSMYIYLIFFIKWPIKWIVFSFELEIIKGAFHFQFYTAGLVWSSQENNPHVVTRVISTKPWRLQIYNRKWVLQTRGVKLIRHRYLWVLPYFNKEDICLLILCHCINSASELLVNETLKTMSENIVLTTVKTIIATTLKIIQPLFDLWDNEVGQSSVVVVVC